MPGYATSRASASDLPTILGAFNVKAYGADPTGSADSTTAFAAAISAAGTAGGGIVAVPPGDYKLYNLATSPITFPWNVSLVGTYRGPLSHVGIRDGSGYASTGGSRLLMPTGGSTNYLTLRDNCAIDGFLMYAPAQTPGTSPPTSGPAWIGMRGKNPCVRNVELLNPYWGIDANSDTTTSTERPIIQGVTGQPLYLGIALGNAGYGGIADCAELSDIQFNPWFSYPGALFSWQLGNGTAFLIGDADEFVATGCFAYGYKYGARFVQGANSFAGRPDPRGAYGSWTGKGFDGCATSIRVETSQAQGDLRFSSVGIANFGIGLDVAGGGIVGLDNLAFWGPAAIHIKNIAGPVMASNTRFNSNASTATVLTTGGITCLTGCLLNNAGPHLVTQTGGKINAVGGAVYQALTQSGTGITTTGLVAY